MRREEIEKKTEDLLLPILEKRNFELWDFEYVKEGKEFYLRAYIDKDGGIMIDDCVDVSHELSDLLDIHDYIDDEYILEVSSPGLGRTIKKDREFTKSLGKMVDIKLYKSIDGQKEFTGNLDGFNDDEITISIDDKPRSFLRKEIGSVKLHVEF